MTLFTTKEEYLFGFQKTFKTTNRSSELLEAYLDKQIAHLNQIDTNLSSETMWQLLPELLGIDARLVLLTELLGYNELSDKDILQMVEKDYLHYFKELCGYPCSMTPKHSLVFNLL